jgi:hypothetical protein
MMIRMRPPAIDSDPVEKCSSLDNNSPIPTRITATTPAVVSILRTTRPFVAGSISEVTSRNGTSAIFGPTPINNSKNVSIANWKSTAV